MDDQDASVEVKNVFDGAEEFYIPKIQELPPEKSRKQQLLDQDRERLEELNAQRRPFPLQPYVAIDTFLSREHDQVKANEDSSGLVESTFREDEVSYKNVSPNCDLVELPHTPFEQLIGPRNFVYRTSQFRKSFETNWHRLDRFLDENDIPRIHNVLKRIKKGEAVNHRLKRYSAEQIKKRIQNEKVADLFGYSTLLPHSLNKSNMSSYEKKLTIMYKYQDMIQDFDYSKRPGSEEKAKMSGMQKKLAELYVVANTPKPEPLIRSASVPARKIKASSMPPGSEAPKRLIAEAAGSEAVIPKKVEKESHPSTSSSSSEKRDNNSAAPVHRKVSKESRSSEDQEPERRHKVHRNNDPGVERERILREKRKEASLKREAEYLANQKKAKEELARQKATEHNEFERRREEIERQKAEYIKEQEREKEARRQESIRKAEELRMFQAREAERKRRMEEERKKREVAEEFERLKRRMEEAVQEQTQRRPQVTAWRSLPVRKPQDWSKRKEKFFSHYDWPTDAAQREVERMQSPRPPPNLMINIPHANNPNTKVKPLSLPKFSLALKSSSSSMSIAAKKPGPVVPVYRPADEQQLEKLVQVIKTLTAQSRRSIANFISLTSKEVNYQDIHLHKLKSSFMYPFYISDGFYWPLIFTLDEPSNTCHVRSLAVCNSFSGKYASRYLLTTPLQEDSFSKKFDANYQDCSGNWADYSQKPGRFSKRLGYKAHYSKSKDSFDVQKQRARDKLNTDFANERREEDEFGRYMDEFRQRGDDRNRNNEYKKHITTHLRQLVKDARLDIYSLRDDQELEYDALSHPGTRESPVPLRWHMHGYKIYLRTRDREYGNYMHKACARYESLMKPRGNSAIIDQFNEWCFTPMLASLHYQSKYAPYDVFSSRETRELSDRYKRYHGLLNERKFSMEQAIRVCRLTTLDKKQWTILHDQLVSHFRDFPAVFHLMFNPKGNMIKRVDKILHKLMSTEFRDRSNAWVFEPMMYSNR